MSNKQEGVTMARCCECKYGDEFVQVAPCRFPLPVWLMREIHDPLTGGGAGASLMDMQAEHNCPCFTRKEEK